MTVVQSTPEVISASLKSHLEQLANSVSFYYGVLLSRDVPGDLAVDLVVDWHRGKVQSWVDTQRIAAERAIKTQAPEEDEHRERHPAAAARRSK